MILVDRKTRKQIGIGDTITCQDGETGQVIGITQPNPTRAGKIYLLVDGVQRIRYPSQLGAEFVPAANNLKHAVGRAIAIKKGKNS